MKNQCYYFLLFVVLIACKNEHELHLATEEFSGENCTACPEIAISVPQVLEKSKLADRINSAISNEITSLLLFEEADNIETHTIKEAIQAFVDEYKEITKLYPDELETWEAIITGEVSYEDKNTLTIILKSYLYSGGAHGYESNRFLNLDKKTGKELKNWQIFEDEEAFTSLAEKAFRKAKDIPENESINATGFMFKNDTFYLPENLGFTKEGIKLHYNQYEVASYADGAIELTLPFNAFQKYLKGKIKKAITITTSED